jgi:heterodisulfide reductase subunit C
MLLPEFEAVWACLACFAECALDKTAGFRLRLLWREADLGLVNIQLGPEGLAGL